jgi:hypothetical protein
MINVLQKPVVIILQGEQIKIQVDTNSQLMSKEVKLSKSAKITKAEGNCKGFWVQKENITVHKFLKLEKSIGTVLKPGTYTVYPMLRKNQTKAKIRLTLTVNQ